MLRALDDAGIADNTIVVFTSEHGDQMGDHHVTGKAVMYEESIRVPLLMRVPWLTDSQTMIPGRLSHIDVVPTLLDLIGEGVPGHLQGTSRVDVFNNEATLDGNDVVIDWNGLKTQMPVMNPEVVDAYQRPHRTLITPEGWKLMLGDPENGELYDLNTDPHEMKNLYRDPAQTDRDSRSRQPYPDVAGPSRGRPRTNRAVNRETSLQPGPKLNIVTAWPEVTTLCPPWALVLNA